MNFFDFCSLYLQASIKTEGMKDSNPGITIVPYSPVYHEGCMAAFISNVPKFFTLEEIEQYKDWLNYLETLPEVPGKLPPSIYYVVLLGTEVIGCGGFGYDETTHQATLAWGLVHNSYHKQYIGSKLLAFRLDKIAALNPAAEILLDTTQHAYPFFERHGFVIQKFTPDSYAIGMHRYDMKWTGKTHTPDPGIVF